jgi:hypothetical protein
MRVIFRGEDKRHYAQMEEEASLIHQGALNHLLESEAANTEIDPDQTLLEELLRKEKEEILALLALMEESDMKDVIMSENDVE